MGGIYLHVKEPDPVVEIGYGANDYDDGYVGRGNTQWFPAGGEIYMGIGAYIGDAYFRFPVTAPQGATINTCYVDWKAWNSHSGNILFNIYFEAADNAAQIYEPPGTNGANAAANADYYARARTVGLPWAPPAWSGDVRYTSIELKSLLQLTVDRPGWVAGNYIQIFVQYVSGDGSRRRNAYNWATGAEHRAKLHYTYL